MRAIRRWAIPSLVVVATVLLWQLLVWLTDSQPSLLPGPWRVLRGTFDDRSDLWPAITTTTAETLMGLALAVVVGFILGLLIDASPLTRRGVYPLLVASQTLPIVAIAPLVVLWWGFGMFPKVVLVALFSFFPIVVGLVDGLAAVDRNRLRMLATMGAGRYDTLRWAKLPSAIGGLFTGLRISVTYAFTAAIVAEYVGSTQGLGYYIYNASKTAPVRADLVFGGAVVTALLTLLLFMVVGVMKRVLTPWKSVER